MTRDEVPAEFLTGAVQPSEAPGNEEPDVFARKPREHATRRQCEYIRDLVASREIPEAARADFERRLTAAFSGDFENGITFARAQEFIPRLKALPKVRPSDGDQPQNSRFKFGPRAEFVTIEADGGKEIKTGKIILPDGRSLLAGSYGIDTTDDDRFTNNFSFFRVWINEEYGKGWGVKLYVSDYTHRVKLAKSTEADVVKAILDAGTDEAARAFGLEFKRCGVCSRGLTNDESRELGIGPVCRARLAGI